MSGGHVALVLAAGGSRRLGRPKQLLTRDGETLVHRTARLAFESGAGRVLVVLGAARREVEAAVAGLGCEVVANPAWEQGLAGSLRAAAAHLQAADGRVLVLPCDLPGLEAAQLRALLDAAAAASSGCAATRLGDVVGVPAVVPGRWWREDALDGDRGFGARLRALAPGTLGVVAHDGLALDVDTAADVEAAWARGWLARGG